MSSTFSTNVTECLNRETEQSAYGAAIDFEQIWDKNRLNECVQFIDSKQCNKVSIALHFIFIPVEQLNSRVLLQFLVIIKRFVYNSPMT